MNFEKTCLIMDNIEDIVIASILLGYIKAKKLHRPGIEPGPPAWQASILPLNQRCLLTRSSD